MLTVISNVTIVTCDAANSVIHGDLVFRGREIIDVGVAGDGRKRGEFAKRIDGSGCALMPGFVQGHIHLCQTLMRGMAEDLLLLDWLKERIWPLEAAHTEKSLSTSAELGLLETMRAGTTSFLDMGTVHHHDAVMDACVRAGARAVSGKAMMDQGRGVPKGLLESTKESLRESERLEKAWSGKGDGRMSYAYAPRFILSCSEELVRGAAALAKERGAMMHTHAAEQEAERQAVREICGDDDIAVLRNWGFSGPRAIFAHGVHLRDEEMATLGKEGTRVVHCPSTNLKLGSGIARIADLDAHGVRLALGADGAPCNNTLDPWQELRRAAQLAKVKNGPLAVSAQRALRLATIDGAVALGLDSITGSLERGKRADMVLVRVDQPHHEPGGDVFTRLVYSTSASDIARVWVDGTEVVRDGEHTLLDREEIVARARIEGKKLWDRSGCV